MKISHKLKSCLVQIMLLSLLVACGRVEVLPAIDDAVFEPMVDRSFSAELSTATGEMRQVDLSLTRNPEGRYVFSLDYLYIGRTLTPTNRTGNWYYEGTTLTLAILEQDGEPVDQSPLLFTVDGTQLRSTSFDKNYFDVDQFILNEVPFNDFLK